MIAVADRVFESATISGSGDISLTGAQTGFRTFASVCSIGNEVCYLAIQGTSWEVRVGVYSATNTIARGSLISSSSGSAISFSGGSPSYVALNNPAESMLSSAYDNISINSEFLMWQRFDSSTYKSLADGSMAADAWFVLSQTGNVEVKKNSVGTELISGMIVKQPNATAQRFGIGQCIDLRDCDIAYSGQKYGVQFRVRNSASAVIRAALLEYTVGSPAQRDCVNNWASASYAAGGFFTAGWNVNTVYQSASGTDISVWFPSAARSVTTSHLMLFIWTESTQAQNFTMEVSEVVLKRGVAPVRYVPPQSHLTRLACFSRYQKSYNQSSYPGAVTDVGMREFFARDYNAQATWNLNYPMGGTPTVTLYSVNTGAANNVYSVFNAVDEPASTEGVGETAFSSFLTTAFAVDLCRFQFEASWEPAT